MKPSRRALLTVTFGLAVLAAWTLSAQPATAPPFGIFNAVEISPGVLSAGQPTAEQLEALQAAGYKAVLDLRAKSEDRGFDEAGLAQTLGLAYENIPITLETLDTAAVERFRTLYKSLPRPLLIHCASANRVGALYFTELVLDEKLSPEAALERARAAGLKHPQLEEKVKSLAGPSAQP